MTRRAWRATALGAAVLAWSWPAPVGAEPSAACRDLAARFANAAADLDTGSLAGLIGCVSTEIQARTGGPALLPPPYSPEVLVPAPAPAPPPPPPVTERGAWPPSVPWGGDWPQAAPWDR